MGALLRRFALTLGDGARLWWLAPAIPAIVLIAELAQHVVEIRLGMFGSRAAFGAYAADPLRMGFGIVKVAALILTILAACRYWASRGTGRHWLDLRGIAWRKLLLALLLIALSLLPGMALAPLVGATGHMVVDAAVSLATLPLMTFLVAGLLGVHEGNLRSVFRDGWWPAVRIFLFSALPWLPLQALHNANHLWALGQAAPSVWALMIFDALVVGLMATLAGTGLHHGFRPLAEPTQRPLAAA